MRRTSSLGRSQGSGLPVRVSSLGQAAESGADMGAQRHLKSFLPKPASRSRSSSVDPEAKQQSRKTLRRSQSNLELQLIASTPATAQSSRTRSPFDFGSQSRKTGHLYSSHVKDPRPLGDKNYQTKEIEKVQEFLIGCKADPKLINAVAKRSLTLNDFVEIASQMLSYFFPKLKLTLTNFVDEIPSLAKKMHYPGNIMKSSLKTANSSHSWPVVLGFLSWMAEILHYHKPEFVQEVLFPTLEELQDDSDTVPHRRKMDYYLQAFEYWNNEKLEEEALEDQKIIEEITNSVDVSDEQINALERERNELQMILENEEHTKLLEHYTQLKELHHKKQAEIHELKEAISQKLCFKNEAPNKLAQMWKTIEVDKALNAKCKTKVDNLLKTLDEARNNNFVELLQESEQVISQCTARLETYEQKANDSEKKLARLQRKAEQLQTKVNKLALESSGSLPILQSITQYGNFPLTETDLQEIEDKLKNWKTELKSEISQLENLLEKKRESLKVKESKHRESKEWKALEKEIQDAEAEELQMKQLEEQEEARLKSELQHIIQENKTLVKDASLIEKAQAILHQKEEEVKQANLHIEQVHQKSQEIINKRVELFDAFMKKVAATLDELKALQ